MIQIGFDMDVVGQRNFSLSADPSPYPNVTNPGSSSKRVQLVTTLPDILFEVDDFNGVELERSLETAEIDTDDFAS